jgi:hypothetical protein
VLLVLLFIAVRLRWQEVWRRWGRVPGFFSNKAPLFSPLRLLNLAFIRGVRQRLARLSFTPPWCWSGGLGPVGEASLNKRLLLRFGGGVLLLLLSLSGLGGAEGDWKPAVYSCKIGGGWGDPHKIVLIQARGGLASAISCRHGGNTETSDEEASFSSAVEARRHLATKWSRPRWLDDGRWQKIYAGREPTSYLLLFLGGDAWRTPPSGGRDTQVLDCFVQIRCRVFFVKCKPLSSNTRFLERVLYKGLSVKFYACHINGSKSRVF